ncbi:MAG: hypothetical protein WCJ19_03145 [bacterium]
MQDNKEDKFIWIKDIINTNVVSKLRGKTFSNIIDVGTTKGSLVTKLKTILTESRYFAYSYVKKESINEIADVVILNNIEEVNKHNYELILSVFDIHSMNSLEINEFLKFIDSISDSETTVLISDIESSNFLSETFLAIAKLFNKRIKTIVPKKDIIQMIQNMGYVISDNDSYKINNVWSAWIITCKKN